MKIIQLSIRTLLRFKLYSSINILGLALSLACVMIISRYVYQELTVDHFNAHLDQICYLTVQMQGESAPRLSGANNPNKDATFIDPYKDPAVLRVSKFCIFAEDDISVDERTFNAAILATDSNFLQILDYPLLAGNRATILTHPQSAVITREFAKKIFGTQNPMGQHLRHSSGQTVIIDGIIDKPASKSSLRFDLLISRSLQSHWSTMPNDLILLAPGTDLNQLNRRNSTYMAASMYMDKLIRYQFIPLKTFYFNTQVLTIRPVFLQGNHTHVLILLGVGLLILLVGVFNFVNIYTVVMLKRAREFGMKKVFGARAHQVIFQLFTENLVMIGIALAIGWLLIEVTARTVQNHLGIPPVSDGSFDLWLSVCILFGLPLLTSVYPFVKYNYAAPVTSLQTVTTSGHSTVSRSLFIVLQYIITFTLVVVSIYFIRQLNFMLHADLGYRTEDIIKTQFIKWQTSYDNHIDESLLEKKVAQIQQAMDECPLFTAWTYGESPNEQPGQIQAKGPDNVFREIGSIDMTSAYFEIFDLRLKEGRLWNDSVDNVHDYQVIINETAKKQLGITDITTQTIQPEKRLWWSMYEENMDKNPPYRIIGVIEDFQMKHLSKSVTPLFITKSWDSPDNKLIAAVAKGRKQEAIRFLKQLHDDTIGGEFEYTFVADEIQQMYKEDRKVTAIYTVFALIAILISSMGLFSLSLFDVQQRYREIALRKVNGAQVSQIMGLLLRKYLLLLGTAFAIAVPLSIGGIREYMQDFVHRVPLSAWIFVAAALLTTFVSLATLLVQIYKAANANPADTLKNQ